MTDRKIHLIHLLIRDWQNEEVSFLVYPHDKWLAAEGQPYLTLPTKKTVAGSIAAFQQGTSLEGFVDIILQEDLHLTEDHYALEHEIEPAYIEMRSPTHNEPTDYTIYPIDVWVAPDQRETLREAVHGEWRTCEEALKDHCLSPTARAVFELLQEREARLDAAYTAAPRRNESRRRLGAY